MHVHSCTLLSHFTRLPCFLAWSRDFILFSKCFCSGARYPHLSAASSVRETNGIDFFCQTTRSICKPVGHLLCPDKFPASSTSPAPSAVENRGRPLENNPFAVDVGVDTTPVFHIPDRCDGLRELAHVVAPALPDVITPP